MFFKGNSLQQAWHPLAQGLVSAMLPNGSLTVKDVLTENLSLPVGSVSVDNTPAFGPAWGSTGTAYVNLRHTGYGLGQRQFTVTALYQPLVLPGAGAQAYILGQSTNGASASVGLGLLIGNGALGSSGLRWIASVRADGSTRVNLFSSTSNITAGTAYVVTMVYDALAGTITLYVDGALAGTLTTSLPTFTSLTPALGPRLLAYADGTLGSNGRIAGLYVWNRALSQPEVAQLSAQVFIPVLGYRASRFTAAQVAQFKALLAAYSNQVLGVVNNA